MLYLKYRQFRGIIERKEDGIKLVKQKVNRMEISKMAALIMKITGVNMEWKNENCFGIQTPKRVEGVDTAKFDIAKFYSQTQIDTVLAG